MSLTSHDILLDADLFRRTYPSWPHAEPDRNPLDGPFVTSRDLTTYSDDPTYPITLPDSEGGDCAERALGRLGFTADNRKAAA